MSSCPIMFGTRVVAVLPIGRGGVGNLGGATSGGGGGGSGGGGGGTPAPTDGGGGAPASAAPAAAGADGAAFQAAADTIALLMDNLNSGFPALLDQEAGIVIEELRKRTPLSQTNPRQNVGGNLYMGWRFRASGPALAGIREVYNIQPYLPYVLRGRGPIDQRLKPGARRLRFYYGTQVYYRWAVGKVAAHPFHLNALTAARRRISADLGITGRRVLFRSTT